jgi:hypothetical protein
MTLRSVAAAAAIVLLTLSPCARAQNTSDVLAEVGLFGTWASDCRHPPSGFIPFSTYSLAADGRVIRTLRRGDDSDHSGDFVIPWARRIAPDQVAMRMEGRDVTYDIILQIENGQFRAYQSQTADGKVMVKDGIVLIDHQPAIWQKKCRENMASLPSTPAPVTPGSPVKTAS